jgi:phage tail sheath gpL-like
MTFPDATSLAPATAGSVQNVPQGVSVTNKVRNGWLIGTYDPAKLAVVDNIPKQYLSAAQVGDELGFGFPLHRMALAWEKQGAGINMWITPQSEEAGATAATGTITVTVTTAEAGTLWLYIANDLVNGVGVTITAGASDADIATAIAAAINADKDLPVTASAALGVVTVTAKAKGTYGNFVSIETDLNVGESTPGGVTLAIVDMATGATDPDIDDALNGNGTGDAANTIDATDCVDAYGIVQAKLTKTSTYNGLGDQKVGCYAPTVGRPMRFFNVSVEPGSTGYTNMKTISDANLYDRTNLLIGMPDTARHPVEAAAEMAGYCAATNQARPADSYVGQPITGSVGDAADRWTDDPDVLDAANKAGIATTRFQNSAIVIWGLVTMYRPASVQVNKNAYRSCRNISIIQNILASHRAFWLQRPSFTIVEDASIVEASQRLTVLDIDAVEDFNGLLAVQWAKKAWLFTASYTIENQVVTIRGQNNGFDIKLPAILSVEGVISNTTVEVDIDVAVLNI